MGAKLSKKRIAITLEAFRTTLLAFCETVIPGGHRSGNKWICGDLHDGEGASCAVWLDSGGFYDSNPAADHVKGGPLDLWKAMFGVSLFTKVIKGMEAWVKDGTLPDGSKGVQTAGRIEAEGETITAQDAYEKKLVTEIRTFQNWIAYAESHPNPYVNLPHGHTIYLGGTSVRKIDWTAYNAENRKQYERSIEKRLSDIYAHRWEKTVDNTKEIREKVATELAEYRGLSIEVFLWLIDNGYIAVSYSEIFDSLEIAFPVFRDTQWFPGSTENDVQFLGMHIPYLTRDGEKRWKYEPKGCGSEPLVVGDLATADLVVIGESTWDVISFLDLRKLYSRGDDKPWAAIATRGASNGGKISKLPVKSDATLLLLMQNDEANEAWFKKLPATVSSKARRIVPPYEIKDLNDWIRNVGADEVNSILNGK